MRSRHPDAVTSPRSRWAGEDGGSPVTSVFGVAIFLGFLLLATQVLVHLYATSTVTAVAFDEARRASGDGGSCVSVEARARDRLGSWGGRADVAVHCDEDGASTVVTVAGPSPARGLGLFGGVVGIDRIERSATFHTEQRPGGS